MKDIIHPKIWIISNDTSRKEKKEKERKTPVPVIPLFSSGNSSLLYPSILDTRLYTPRSHYRGREGKERREGRKAARGKENLADPLSLFTPPGAGARVESPLATVYWTHANIHGNEGPPWEATPVASSFCVLVGGVRFQRYRGGREREEEAFGKNFLLIRDLFLPSPPYFLIHSLCLENLSPLEKKGELLLLATTLKWSRRKFTRSFLKLFFQISKEMVRSVATNCIVNYLNKKDQKNLARFDQFIKVLESSKWKIFSYVLISSNQRGFETWII